MFMMHQLGRLDIWPTGDLGVRRGWEKIYKLKEEIKPNVLDKNGEKFRPYRSVVQTLGTVTNARLNLLSLFARHLFLRGSLFLGQRLFFDQALN